MYICLFSRQNTCAPVDANACGSSGSPTLWTRSIGLRKGSKGLPRPSKAAADTLQGLRAAPAAPAGCVLPRDGRHQPRGRSYPRGRNYPREGLGGIGWGVAIKNNKISIYTFFLFFHFLYDFSKSIGTTHPNNLKIKKQARETTHLFLLLQNCVRVPSNPTTLEGTQSHRGLF